MTCKFFFLAKMAVASFVVTIQQFAIAFSVLLALRFVSGLPHGGFMGTRDTKSIQSLLFQQPASKVRLGIMLGGGVLVTPYDAQDATTNTATTNWASDGRVVPRGPQAFQQHLTTTMLSAMTPAKKDESLGARINSLRRILMRYKYQQAPWSVHKRALTYNGSWRPAGRR